MDNFDGSYDDSEYDHGADDGYSLDDTNGGQIGSPLSDAELPYDPVETVYSNELDEQLDVDPNLFTPGSPSIRFSGTLFAPATPLVSGVINSDSNNGSNGLEDIYRPEKRRKLSENEAVPSDAPQLPPFTDEEDAKLLQFLDIHGENWKVIAALLETNRHPGDVKDRWRKLREKARRRTRRSAAPQQIQVKPDPLLNRAHRYPIVKRFWSIDEDQKLRELVELHGAHNWPKIALHMQGRSDNDCHSRWSRHLDPRINKMPFTSEEDEQLLELQKKMGNRWKDIALVLNTSRSGVQIHGRWLQLSKKERKIDGVTAETAPPVAPPKSKRTRKPREPIAKVPKKRGRRPKAAIPAITVTPSPDAITPLPGTAVDHTYSDYSPPDELAVYAEQASSYEDDDVSGDWHLGTSDGGISYDDDLALMEADALLSPVLGQNGGF